MADDMAIMSQDDLAYVLGVPSYMVRKAAHANGGNRPRAYISAKTCIAVYEQLKKDPAAIPYLSTRAARLRTNSEYTQFALSPGMCSSSRSLLILGKTINSRQDGWLSPNRLTLLSRIGAYFDQDSSRSPVRRITTSTLTAVGVEIYGMSDPDFAVLKDIVENTPVEELTSQQTFFKSIRKCPTCGRPVLHPDIGCVYCMVKIYMPELE